MDVGNNKKNKMYICKICNYTTNRKSNFENHLNRKTPCEKNVDNMLKGYNNNNSFNSSIESTSTCIKCSKIFSTKWNLKRHMLSCSGSPKLTCDTCHKSFKSTWCKNKHQKTVACMPIKFQSNDYIQNITNTNSNNNNIINNNSTLNIINNITVNPFGKENYDYLLDENQRLKKIIENKDAFMQKMITLVHFDREHPENHNIMMTNMQSKHVHVYDGEKFVKALKEQTFDKLITDKRDFIVSNVDDLRLTKDCEKELKDKLTTIKLNQEKRKLLKNKVELICYNNKDLIVH